MDKPNQRRDFFISYTQADRAWAEWIAWQLEAERYTTVLQAWDFRPGENFVARMRDALQGADRTIAVLSAAYLASPYGTDEWTGAFVHDPDGRQRLLPVRVEACQPPRLLATLVYIDLVGLDQSTTRRRLLEGVRQGRRRPEEEPGFPGGHGQRTEPGIEPRFPGQRPEISNLPARNPNFTGRTKLLGQLRRNLTSGGAAAVVQAQAIHGLGGVGKTQLATEYAHRHQGDYDLIWWITAERPAAIPGQLAALARWLGVPEAAEQGETIQTLWQELSRRDRWLLIFDNAEDPTDLRPWWPPSGGGQVLVTSRNPAVGGLTATTLVVDVLPRREAVSFLHRRAGALSMAAGELAETLGDLPLALEQAAAYLIETGTPVAEYLELLRDRAPELFALGRPATSEQTIATIWATSLERIRTETPVAQDLLCLCAFLAPDDLPRALLLDHPEVLPDPLATAVRDRVAFQQAMGALRRYSLVTTTGDTLRLHRLVQAVTRQALTAEQQQQWATVAVRLVLAGFPDRAEDIVKVATAARMLPHALTATSHPAPYVNDPEATVSLLNHVGEYVWGWADYQQAKRLYEKAMSTAEARLGSDHPLTAYSLHNLAHVLHAQGDPDRARTEFEHALAFFEAQPDPNHLTTAHITNNLADVLVDLADLDGAQTLYERVLAIREASLGPDHPEVATVLTQLALMLAEQGDLARARSLHQRALAIREASLGTNHPLTAWSLTSLGAVLHQQGDLAHARTLHERALGIYEARLADHPYTAIPLTNLGALLRAQDELDAARTLHERALAIREARLGTNHPLTALSLDHIAEILAEQGDLNDARTLHERALHIREARLGADNPHTAQSLSSLANILHAQGDLDGARRLHERALAIFEARLGYDHPNTVGSRERLALVTAELENRL